MKKYFIASLFLFTPMMVLAAGGGGGGSYFFPTAPAPTPTPTSTSIVISTSTTMLPATVSTSPIAPTSASSVLPLKVAPVTALTTTLRCDQPTLAQRIQCRLALTPEELKNELEIQYLPEECRPLIGNQQKVCAQRYRDLLPCWMLPVGSKRTSCAIKKLGLNVSPTADFKRCLKQTGKARTDCQTGVKNKTYSLIKFHFYDLSERAEDTRDKGVSLDAVVKLVTAMETNKQMFNQATTTIARQQTILASRAAWKKFISVANKKEKAIDYLDQALVDLKIVK